MVVTGRKFWSFPRLTRDCRNDDRTKFPDRVFQISESCSQMVLQFHDQIEVIEDFTELPLTCFFFCLFCF